MEKDEANDQIVNDDDYDLEEIMRIVDDDEK